MIQDIGRLRVMAPVRTSIKGGGDSWSDVLSDGKVHVMTWMGIGRGPGLRGAAEVLATAMTYCCLTIVTVVGFTRCAPIDWTFSMPAPKPQSSATKGERSPCVDVVGKSSDRGVWPTY